MNHRDMSYPNLYNILGVHPEVPASVIEETYLRLRDQYQDSPERQHALGVAWAVLGDRQRRAMYDREAVGVRHNAGADALRPLVSWVVVYMTTVAFLLALGVRDIGSLAFVSYASACTPWGWRTLSRLRRWLWMRGVVSWLYCLAVSPIVGVFAAPVQLTRSVITLWRLWRWLTGAYHAVRLRLRRERP